MGRDRDDDQELSAEDVRRRFVWARRQGRPAWLWPDVPIPAWRAALAGIEAVIVRALASQDAAIDGDPEAIGLAGYTSGMGPLLGWWVEQGRLDAGVAVADVLRRHLAHNRIRAARMATASAELVGRLAERGIGSLVLKGAHTGPAYFPEAGTRPASDIDLLVRPSDVAAAQAVLRREGLVLTGRGPWESNWRPAALAAAPRSLSYVHAENPWSVDLHESLTVTAGGGAPLAELDLADPMDSRSRWPADPRAGVLDQPLLVLYLAAHAGAGWHSLTLLRQLELALVIQQDAAAGRLSWDELLAVGRRTGVLGYAYPALRLAGTLAPGIVPEAVLQACAASAPPAVRRALAGLTPASAQRVDRSSLAEHFMWAAGWRARLRQLASDALPSVGSSSAILKIYEERAWRLIRGTVSQ